MFGGRIMVLPFEFRISNVGLTMLAPVLRRRLPLVGHLVGVAGLFAISLTEKEV